MKGTIILVGLALVLPVLSGCGQKRPIDAPEERPDDFVVSLTSRAYPIPAPDLRIQIWGSGSGVYEFVFKEPRPGIAQGQFELTPEQLDEVYRVVRESGFFELDEDYIADPPIRGRGVDEIVISAAGGQHVVRSEYDLVEELDLVREAVLDVVPEEAREGISLMRESKGYVVDRVSGLIHDADAPEVESIPEKNRIKYSNIYEALDAGYHPAPSSHVFDR